MIKYRLSRMEDEIKAISEELNRFIQIKRTTAEYKQCIERIISYINYHIIRADNTLKEISNDPNTVKKYE